MSAGVNNLLAKATGPSRLREELRMRTKSVTTFLKALEGISTVQTEVPKNVLGGDIIALMSGRLQQLLQYSESTQNVTAAGPSRRSRFTTGPYLSVGPETAKFSLDPEFVKKPANPFASKASASETQTRSFPMPPLSNVDAETSPFLPSQSPEVAITHQESGSRVPNSTRPSILEKDGIAEEHRSSSQEVTSIFVEKLREYWRLSQREQPARQSSNHPAEAGVVKGRDTTTFSESPLSTLSKRSWPEITGRQVARRVESLISGRSISGSPKHIYQNIQSDLPEKMEIQNVFNIEVSGDVGKEAQSVKDLPEKIADVLREQALQHGIDIT